MPDQTLYTIQNDNGERGYIQKLEITDKGVTEINEHADYTQAFDWSKRHAYTLISEKEYNDMLNLIMKHLEDSDAIHVWAMEGATDYLLQKNKLTLKVDIKI